MDQRHGFRAWTRELGLGKLNLDWAALQTGDEVLSPAVVYWLIHSISPDALNPIHCSIKQDIDLAKTSDRALRAQRDALVSHISLVQRRIESEKRKDLSSFARETQVEMKRATETLNRLKKSCVDKLLQEAYRGIDTLQKTREWVHGMNQEWSSISEELVYRLTEEEAIWEAEKDRDGLEKFTVELQRIAKALVDVEMQCLTALEFGDRKASPGVYAQLEGVILPEIAELKLMGVKHHSLKFDIGQREKQLERVESIKSQAVSQKRQLKLLTAKLDRQNLQVKGLCTVAEELVGCIEDLNEPEESLELTTEELAFNECFKELAEFEDFKDATSFDQVLSILEGLEEEVEKETERQRLVLESKDSMLRDLCEIQDSLYCTMFESPTLPKVSFPGEVDLDLVDGSVCDTAGQIQHLRVEFAVLVNSISSLDAEAAYAKKQLFIDFHTNPDALDKNTVRFVERIAAYSR